jgi:hypothetical protein
VDGSRGVLAPFNSLVLETVTVSKAFVVASTAAMIAVDMLTPSNSACGLLYWCSKARTESQPLPFETKSQNIKI